MCFFLNQLYHFLHTLFLYRREAKQYLFEEMSCEEGVIDQRPFIEQEASSSSSNVIQEGHRRTGK